jgi:dTDP-glucose 4,6-dehydratase
MRVLVTGGAGFIGSHLVRLLVKEQHHVCVLDKFTYAGNRSTLDDLRDNPHLEIVAGDICDETLVSTTFEQFQPDWVMHLAAESHVDRSIDDPGLFVQTNVVGTFVMLETALRYWRSKLSGNRQGPGFRFLHVSTDEVYGSLGSEGKFLESSPYDPHSPYAASKASADHFARAWHTTYGLPVIVTNSGNNYGPYQYPEKLIPLAILKCLRGEPVPVYGDGSQSRHWIYVEDHCEALYQVMLKGTIGETFNIAGGTELSNLALIKRLCSILDRELGRNGQSSCDHLIQFVADRPGHDLRYALDTSKIQREIGWSPSTSLEVGLSKTVDWYRSHALWWQAILERSNPLQRQGLPGL